jgi:hypothetical protein
METTANRVPVHTGDEVNQRIRRQTDGNIRYYADHLDEIDDRLAEPERDWDIERTLEANAASISVITVLLGLMTAKPKLVHRAEDRRRVPIATGASKPVPAASVLPPTRHQDPD